MNAVGNALTITSFVALLLQVVLVFVTVTLTIIVPAAPAVTSTELPVALPMIMPPVTLHKKVALAASVVTVYVCVVPVHTGSSPLMLAVGAAVTVNEPPPDARSVDSPVFVAVTVKLVVPPGVALVVVMVNVAVCLLQAAVGSLVGGEHAGNETELGENIAVAPVGKEVVILRAAVNAPAEPVPVPLFTVIV